MDLWVYAGSCVMVVGMMFLAAVCIHLTLKLIDIIGEPVEFMLRRGWAQCTCCDCLTRADRVLQVDDFGGSGPGAVCLSCYIGGEKTQLLFMMLGDGERFYRILDLQQRGELTQGMLELEVAVHLSKYQPEG